MASLQILEQPCSVSIEYDARVRSTLNASEMHALQAFLAYVEEAGKCAKITLTAIRVSVEAEDDVAQVVTAIYVDADAGKAMAFWNVLENDTVKWLDGQDTPTRGLLSDHVVTVVRW